VWPHVMWVVVPLHIFVVSVPTKTTMMKRDDLRKRRRKGNRELLFLYCFRHSIVSLFSSDENTRISDGRTKKFLGASRRIVGVK
jgi:hypothetical protein